MPKTAAKAPKKTYKIGVGDSVPDFSLPATSEKTLGRSDLKGQLAVIYFYPKDSTPGCTIEGQDFRMLHAQFRNAGCEIVGVSKDSVASHEKFKAKCDFPFELISDEDGGLCKIFDVFQMKSLYGRKFMGIERSTFVLSKSGSILAEWRKVKVAGHAEAVLDFVKSVKGK